MTNPEVVLTGGPVGRPVEIRRELARRADPVVVV
jgi:hypothetical protein